jgi:Ca2+-binding RTX toxin-like protein
VEGRGGNDVVFFDTGPTPARGVRVDLALGEARGRGFDRLYDVESADGTRFADILKGSDGRNLLSGGRGDDLIRGRAGNDFVGGYGGRDTLYGGPGADRLEGGWGRDTAYGGRGADRFHVAEEENGDPPQRDAVWGGPGSDWARFDYLDRLRSIEVRQIYE